MLFRQKINISAIILPMHFDKGLLLQTFFRALVVSGVLALGAAAAVFGQETLQTQPSPSPAARPPADQTPGANQVPAAAIPPKPVAIYNLLQKKSVVFP